MTFVTHAVDWLAEGHRKATGRVLFLVVLVLATIAFWGVPFGELLSRFPL